MVVVGVAYILSLTAVEPIAAGIRSPGHAQDMRPDTITVLAVDSATASSIPTFEVLVTGLSTRETGIGVRFAGGVRAVMRLDTLGYIVRVSATGYATTNRRVDQAVLQRSAGTVRILLRRPDTQRDTNGVALSAVQVQATRPKPSRNDNSTAGALDARRSAAGGSVDPTEANSVAAIAAGFSNVQSTAEGLSVFGLAGNQSSVTLNGLQFSDASLPRNLSTSARLMSNVFDPAKGWYSGAETQIVIDPGESYATRQATVSREESSAPALQAGQRGVRADRTVIGVGASGITWRDRLSYNAAVDLDLSTSPIVTLENASASEWSLSGISETVARNVLDAGHQLGLAPNSVGDRDRRDLNALSFAARLNTPLEDPNMLTEARRSFGFTVFGSKTTERPIDYSSYASVSTLRERARSSLGAQLEYSYFPSPATLVEVSTGLSDTRSRTDAPSAVPRYTVSMLEDTELGAPPQSFALGGSGLGNSELRAVMWESRASARFYLRQAPKHRWQVTAGARTELADSRLDGSAATLTFRSVDDLLRGAPVATERLVQYPSATARGTNAFVALGDYWRPAPGWQLMLGARLERTDAPSIAYASHSLRDAFPGAIVDDVSSWHVSPRFGLSWQYRSGASGMVTMSPVGTVFSPTPGILKIGIGEFRGVVAPHRLLQLASIGRVAVSETCWYGDGGGTIASGNPDAPCAGATTAQRDTIAQYRVIGRGFAPPRSWRSHVATAFANRFAELQVELAASLGLDQPVSDPLNMPARPQFHEGLEGRAMYVAPDAIAHDGGFLRTAVALERPALGNVLRTSSDGRIAATQATIILQPNIQPFFVGIGYTLSSAREYTSAFSATAFGSVTDRGWRRSSLDARHSVVLQLGKFWKAIAVSGFGIARSGTPFNPVWATDINGDGRANDRVSQALFASYFADGGGRGCVARRIDGREFPECEAPWTVTANAQVVLTGRQISPAFSRVTGRLFVSNLAGLVDRAVNGSDLKGWGRTAAYDGAAFRVGTFDRATQSYVPIPNTQFGRNRAGSGQLAPFRIVLDASINFSVDADKQQLDRYVRSGRAGRSGKRYTVDELATRYARTVPDAYERLLSFRDSVRLSNDQIRSLMARLASHVPKVNDAWRDMAAWLHDLPDTFDSDVVVRRQKVTTNAIWEMNRLEVQAFLPTLLSPEQIARLPYPANALMREQKPYTAQR